MCVPEQNIATVTIPTGDPTPQNNTSTATVPCGQTPSECTVLQVAPQQGSIPLTSQFACQGIGTNYLIQIINLATSAVIGTIPAQQ